jgi:hypothetical protein
LFWPENLTSRPGAYWDYLKALKAWDLTNDGPNSIAGVFFRAWSNLGRLKTPFLNFMSHGHHDNFASLFYARRLSLRFEKALGFQGRAGGLAKGTGKRLGFFIPWPG